MVNPLLNAIFSQVAVNQREHEKKSRALWPAPSLYACVPISLASASFALPLEITTTILAMIIILPF